MLQTDVHEIDVAGQLAQVQLLSLLFVVHFHAISSARAPLITISLF